MPTIAANTQQYHRYTNVMWSMENQEQKEPRATHVPLSLGSRMINAKHVIVNYTKYILNKHSWVSWMCEEMHYWKAVHVKKCDIKSVFPSFVNHLLHMLFPRYWLRRKHKTNSILFIYNHKLILFYELYFHRNVGYIKSIWIRFYAERSTKIMVINET